MGEERRKRIPIKAEYKSHREGFCEECKMTGFEPEELKVYAKCVNDSYNERLKPIIAEINKNFAPLELGWPCEALLTAGLPALPIQISVKILVGKKSQANHPFKLPEVSHLPDFISDPIAIFRSASTVEDRKVILTEMESDGANILVIIAPSKNYTGKEINDVRSIYPKNNPSAVLGWIEANLMEYCNKQKILKWLSKHQSNSDEVTKLLKDCTKIIENL